MSYETTGVLGVKRNGRTKAARFALPKMPAITAIALAAGSHDEDALRRLLIDREGILDMLVKGRGSGLWL